MNITHGVIGVHHTGRRGRAVAIVLSRGWPVSRGCTPPCVPVWVAEMVKR